MLSRKEKARIGAQISNSPWTGSEGMSGHYDRIKNDVAFRKDVANRVGVGFDVPASLVSIEPNEPKIEVAVEETEVVNA
jgi:hypothetical protein